MGWVRRLDAPPPRRAGNQLTMVYNPGQPNDVAFPYWCTPPTQFDRWRVSILIRLFPKRTIPPCRRPDVLRAFWAFRDVTTSPLGSPWPIVVMKKKDVFWPRFCSSVRRSLSQVLHLVRINRRPEAKAPYSNPATIAVTTPWSSAARPTGPRRSFQMARVNCPFFVRESLRTTNATRPRNRTSISVPSARSGIRNFGPRGSFPTTEFFSEFPPAFTVRLVSIPRAYRSEILSNAAAPTIPDLVLSRDRTHRGVISNPQKTLLIKNPE